MNNNSFTLKDKRPLSPHLTIYKPQINTILSIGHRISGFGLFMMLLFFGWVFTLWVFNGFSDVYSELFSYKLVKLLLAMTSYGYFYHLCTGIRHLFWDIGIGFSIKSVDISGYIAIIISFIMTIIFWYMILGGLA
ncbi:MAG: succinate dehydrogenase, cytochrome b556 subunit [Rickettsiaceae bacterium]|nr:succinate dehydrogenase, cytochrome b556 subunit [Rickettsiaceae bacterium]